MSTEDDHVQGNYGNPYILRIWHREATDYQAECLIIEYAGAGKRYIQVWPTVNRSLPVVNQSWSLPDNAVEWKPVQDPDLPGEKQMVWIACAQKYEHDPVMVGVFSSMDRALTEASGLVESKGDDRLAWTWWVDSKWVQD